MKGPKGDIKTTINPIRTVTPRFIQKIIDRNGYGPTYSDAADAIKGDVQKGWNLFKKIVREAKEGSDKDNAIVIEASDYDIGDGQPG